MDLQAYLREHFSGKRIILVGNSAFDADWSELIDSHELVVRFNIFNNPPPQRRGKGSKTDCWCLNLKTNEQKSERNKLCGELKKRDPRVHVITPYANDDDRHRRLATAIKYYAERGLKLIYPDKPLDTKLSKQARVGYYLAYRLTSLGIPISVIGFTEEASRYHDGHSENAWLGSHCLVTFLPPVSSRHQRRP